MKKEQIKIWGSQKAFSTKTCAQQVLFWFWMTRIILYTVFSEQNIDHVALLIEIDSRSVYAIINAMDNWIQKHLFPRKEQAFQTFISLKSLSTKIVSKVNKYLTMEYCRIHMHTYVTNIHIYEYTYITENQYIILAPHSSVRALLMSKKLDLRARKAWEGSAQRQQADNLSHTFCIL